jgi:hypothetical protein
MWRNAEGRVAVLLAALFVVAGAGPLELVAQELGRTVDVGATGFDVSRPVLAAACPRGCPWGELGEWVRDAMAPIGYEVILCRNCNLSLGPPLVATRAYPPPLDALAIRIGTTERVNAPLDFGVTSDRALAAAYEGTGNYADDGPYRDLRLLAKIEDPSYLMAAVKADSDIADLRQIAARRMPVRILDSGADGVLEYYGLTPEAVESWGGSIGRPSGLNTDADFDLLIGPNASPANNPEAAYWSAYAHRYKLRFLEFDEDLLDELAQEPGVERVVAKWGLLPGVDRPIPTVARSGQVVFARADLAEEVAYRIAAALDEHQGGLRWYIRAYSYDPTTVWEARGVPLHPGAERYYRERGYMR